MEQINLWEDLVEDLAYSMGNFDHSAIDNCEPLPPWEELYHRNPNDNDFFSVSSDDGFDPDELCASEFSPMGNNIDGSSFTSDPVGPKELLGRLHATGSLNITQTKDERSHIEVASNMCHTREDDDKRTTKKHYSARDCTKHGETDRGIHAKHSRSWAGRSHKRGSYSQQSFKRKYPVILGRDFILIDRKVQSTLTATKAFCFFHRPSFSPVEIRSISGSSEDPMNCDSQAFALGISTVDELANTLGGEPVLTSVGDIEMPPISTEATLAHQGSTVSNLRSKRIIAFKEDVSEDVLSYENILFPDSATQRLQKSLSQDQNIGFDKVKGEESDINAIKSRITDTGDGGLHIACSSNYMLRHLKSVRLKASRTSSAKKRVRHLGTSEICRALRHFSRLKSIDGGQSVKPFKEIARHKRKRTHSIEDSYFDPHVFRAPQRRVLP